MKKSRMVVLIGLISLSSFQASAVSYEVRQDSQNRPVLVPAQVSAPTSATEVYYLQVGSGGQVIPVHIPSGCASQPVIVERKRDRSITWDDHDRGGSSSRYSYSVDSSASASALAQGYGNLAKAQANQGLHIRESGASSDWYDHKSKGKDVQQDSEKFIYFDCKNPAD